MEGGKALMTRVCVRCQKNLPDDANVCPRCGHDYRPIMMGHAWEEEKTPLPPLGGALIALSGVVQIVSGLLWLSEKGFSSGLTENHLEAIYIAIGLAVIVVGIFAVLVSPFAMTRRRLALSLVGGLAALGGGSLVVMYMSVSIVAGSLGLVGILLIALAREEFVD